MRTTLHIVPADELIFFVQAYAERRIPVELREQASLLVQAGICHEAEAEARLRELHSKVMDLLAEKGPSTVRNLCQAVPELQARVRHDVGKPYEGEFSIGSRLVPSMCTMGLLIRTQPRGTWRSSLYEYAALNDWLSELDLMSVEPRDARNWLVRRYLSAFGPVTFDETGQNAHPMLVTQVMMGEFITVWPADAATMAPIWPAPEWSARDDFEYPDMED